jgi:hypothetical protein
MMFQTVEKHCNPALDSKNAASCRDTPGVDGRLPPYEIVYRLRGAETSRRGSRRGSISLARATAAIDWNLNIRPGAWA